MLSPFCRSSAESVMRIVSSAYKSVNNLSSIWACSMSPEDAHVTPLKPFETRKFSKSFKYRLIRTGIDYHPA